MKSFIRVTEIWLPDAAGDRLVSGGGLYGDLAAFRAESEGTSFARGEGLPGKAWAERRPVVLKGFEGSYFKRTDAALAAGLTCGVALPIFSGNAIRAVVVFFCGDDAEHVGAIEVWCNNPATDKQIGFVDGYFGTAELFALTARMTKFGRGTGLPGMVWGTDMPVILDELYSASRFLRRDEALKIGLNTGIGLPVGSDPDRTWIMTFLSALGTPIAHRFEIWVPDEAGGLVFQSGLCDRTPGLAADQAGATVAPGEGPVGRCLASGLPVAAESLAGAPPAIAASLASAGLSSAVVIPTLDGAGALKAAVAWYF